MSLIARQALPCVVLVALSVPGCSEVLGGLEEGRSRSPPTPSHAADAGVADARRATAWLDGFGHRVPFTIENAESTTLQGFSTRLGLDTRTLIEAGKMRGDGADIRVTGPDGRTVVPHWSESAPTGEATTLWARFELVSGRNVVFVYYGSDAARSMVSLRGTFIDGIITNPSFNEGTAPWVAVTPTRGGIGDLRIRAPLAEVGLSRPAADADSTLAWCQLVTFPEGRRYRLVFDVDVTQLDNARVLAWKGGHEGAPIWTLEQGIGPHRGVDSSVVEPGLTTICLGGMVLAAPSPQRLVATFSNVRVRAFASNDPIASPAGPEETF